MIQEWKDGDKGWLKELLSDNIVTVTFEKTDGTERVMKASLIPGVIPKVEVVEGKVKRTKKENPDVLSVVDVDKGEWRSFRFDKLKTIEWSV